MFHFFLAHKKSFGFLFIFAVIPTLLFSYFIVSPQHVYANPAAQNTIKNDPNLLNFGISLNPTNAGCTFSNKSDPEVLTCIAGIPYFFYNIAAYMVGFVGQFFDALLAFSLSSEIIKGSFGQGDPEFIDRGWVISRDIANMGFIFILLYVAIATILQLAGGQTKRFLVSIIIMALLVNFSLYFTRIVIDVGNVFALEFYNAISVLDENNQPIQTNIEFFGVQARPVSAGLMSSFSLQQLLGDPEVIAALDNAGLFAWASAATMSFFLMLIVLYVLAIMSLIFIGRVIVFWLLMMVAPIAFMSSILPRTKGMIWDKWVSHLVNQTIVAPVFLFFVYFAMTIAQSPGLKIIVASVKNIQGGYLATYIPALLAVTLPFFIIMIFLLMGVRVAKSLAGEAGAGAIHWGKFLGGGAIGLAAGSAAFGARKVLSGAGQKLAESKAVKELENSGGRFGRTVAQGVRATASGSYDLRNIPGVASIAQKSGLDVGKAGGLVGTKSILGRSAAEKADQRAQSDASTYKRLGTDSERLRFVDKLRSDRALDRLYASLGANERASLMASAQNNPTLRSRLESAQSRLVNARGDNDIEKQRKREFEQAYGKQLLLDLRQKEEGGKLVARNTKEQVDYLLGSDDQNRPRFNDERIEQLLSPGNLDPEAIVKIQKELSERKKAVDHLDDAAPEKQRVVSQVERFNTLLKNSRTEDEMVKIQEAEDRVKKLDEKRMAKEKQKNSKEEFEKFLREYPTASDEEKQRIEARSVINLRNFNSSDIASFDTDLLSSEFVAKNLSANDIAKLAGSAKTRGEIGSIIDAVAKHGSKNTLNELLTNPRNKQEIRTLIDADMQEKLEEAWRRKYQPPEPSPIILP